MNAKDMMTGVEALIKDGQTKIIEDVKHTLAGIEMERRERAIIEGLKRLPALEEAVKEIEPDVKTFQADGEPMPPTYSEERFKS